MIKRTIHSFTHTTQVPFQCGSLFFLHFIHYFLHKIFIIIIININFWRDREREEKKGGRERKGVTVHYMIPTNTGAGVCTKLPDKQKKLTKYPDTHTHTHTILYT